MSAESNILRCFVAIMSQHNISVDYVFLLLLWLSSTLVCTFLLFCLATAVTQRNIPNIYFEWVLFNMLYFIIIHVLHSYFFLVSILTSLCISSSENIISFLFHIIEKFSFLLLKIALEEDERKIFYCWIIFEKYFLMQGKFFFNFLFVKFSKK